MQHRDKIDNVFASTKASDLLTWMQVHAYVDEKFALALLDRFWTPEQEDEKAMVERCFMNPSSSCVLGIVICWTCGLNNLRGGELSFKISH